MALFIFFRKYYKISITVFGTLKKMITFVQVLNCDANRSNAERYKIGNNFGFGVLKY